MQSGGLTDSSAKCGWLSGQSAMSSAIFRIPLLRYNTPESHTCFHQMKTDPVYTRTHRTIQARRESCFNLKPLPESTHRTGWWCHVRGSFTDRVSISREGVGDYLLSMQPQHRQARVAPLQNARQAGQQTAIRARCRYHNATSLTTHEPSTCRMCKQPIRVTAGPYPWWELSSSIYLAHTNPTYVTHLPSMRKTLNFVLAPVWQTR